jgi:hypothetical protein
MPASAAKKANGNGGIYPPTLGTGTKKRLEKSSPFPLIKNTI